MTTELRQQRFRFGDFELDSATRQLLRSGVPVTLQPRVFDLLAYLIEQRHRAVDKDAIQDAVWSPVIVSETALTRAIMKARRAVGDDAEHQSVIRTVHGHGYQFVAQLQEDDAVAHEASDSRQPLPSSGASSQHKMRLLLAAAALLLVVGIAMLARTPATASGIRVAVVPVQNVTGDEEFDWAKFGLMGLTNDLLVDAADLDIVSAADVVKFVQNNRWSGSIDASAEDEYIDALRRAYGASHVLISRLEQNVGGLRLNYTLVGPDGRRSENTMVSDQAPALVRGMVRSVSAMLGTRRRVPDEEMVVIDDDPFINEAYARGINFSLQGRCAQAQPLFEVVLARNDAVRRAQYEWAGCARILGHWQEAETAYKAMLVTLESETTSSLRADVLRGLGTVYHRTGRLDEADTAYQQSFDEAIRAEDRLIQGRLLISQSILAKDHRDFDTARQLLARATLIYRELEWEILPGQIFSSLANIAMNDGQLNAAEDHLDEALKSFRQLGDRRNEAMMLNNYGFLRRSQGRFEEAEPLHLQSLAIRREIGDHVGQGRILGMLSILYEQKGRHEDAMAAAAEAVAIAREANDRLFIATGLAQLAAAQHGNGDLTTARKTYDESRATFLEIDDKSRAAQVDLRLAKLDIDTGNLDAADGRIREVLNTSIEAGYPEPAIDAMDYAGDIAKLRGESDEAIRFFEQALTHIDETGFTSKKTAIAIKLSHLYLDQDNLAGAELLLGYIVEQDGTPESYELRARYASMTGDAIRSVTLQETAKELRENSVQ